MDADEKFAELERRVEVLEVVVREQERVIEQLLSRNVERFLEQVEGRET